MSRTILQTSQGDVVEYRIHRTKVGTFQNRWEISSNKVPQAVTEDRITYADGSWYCTTDGSNFNATGDGFIIPQRPYNLRHLDATDRQNLSDVELWNLAGNGCRVRQRNNSPREPLLIVAARFEYRPWWLALSDPGGNYGDILNRADFTFGNYVIAAPPTATGVEPHVSNYGQYLLEQQDNEVLQAEQGNVLYPTNTPFYGPRYEETRIWDDPHPDSWFPAVGDRIIVTKVGPSGIWWRHDGPEVADPDHEPSYHIPSRHLLRHFFK